MDRMCFLSINSAFIAASSLCVRINRNELCHICAADCVGFLADLTHMCSQFVCEYSLSVCFCTQVCSDHAYVLGLVCQDQRQAPRVCEVFPSCIAPCLGSPRPLIIPTLALISLPLSLPCTHTHTHTVSFLLSHSACVSLSLSVISLFMFDLFAVLHQLMMVQG